MSVLEEFIAVLGKKEFTIGPISRTFDKFYCVCKFFAVLLASENADSHETIQWLNTGIYRLIIKALPNSIRIQSEDKYE